LNIPILPKTTASAPPHAGAARMLIAIRPSHCSQRAAGKTLKRELREP
jgi:hypothetical protein